jgi:hypothetical protein
MPIDFGRYVPKEAVVFEVEIPKTLRFKSITEGSIKAHKGPLKEEVTMPCLILDVTFENGKPVIKKWYCASKKAIMVLKPYIEDRSYTKREFTVIKHGVAPAAWYEITVGATK